MCSATASDTGTARRVPLTAACRSDVTRSSVAERLVVLADARDVVASHRTDNTGGGKHGEKGLLLGNMRVPPNSITFSQEFADDVRANKARGTSNLPVDVRTPRHSKWIYACHVLEQQS